MTGHYLIKLLLVDVPANADLPEIIGALGS
jgi:hypothetical protein